MLQCKTHIFFKVVKRTKIIRVFTRKYVLLILLFVKFTEVFFQCTGLI